jgi:hypothetical protein
LETDCEAIESDAIQSDDYDADVDDDDFDLIRQVNFSKDDLLNVSVDGDDYADDVAPIAEKIESVNLDEDSTSPAADDILEGLYPITKWQDPILPMDWTVGTERRLVVTGIDGRGQLYAQNPKDWKILDRVMGFFFASLYSDLVGHILLTRLSMFCLELFGLVWSSNKMFPLAAASFSQAE